MGLWLCGLPLRLRCVLPCPSSSTRLTLARRTRGHRLEMDATVIETVVRLCQARLFRLPLFPRPCLRQALALYYVLTRLGYPVAIHFGVRKEGEELHGHSWVTVQGTPVAERTRTDLFTTVYSYPSTCRPLSSHAHRGMLTCQGGPHGQGPDRPSHQPRRIRGSSRPAPGKQPWQEPKLTFVEPTLTKHGTLQELTGQGFFGGFHSVACPTEVRPWPGIPSRN